MRLWRFRADPRSARLRPASGGESEVHHEEEKAEEPGNGDRLMAAAQPQRLGRDTHRVRDHLPAVESGESADGDPSTARSGGDEDNSPASCLTGASLDGALDDAVFDTTQSSQEP